MYGTRSPVSTRRFLKCVLAAATGVLIAVGVPVQGQTETAVNAADYTSHIVAQFDAVQNAVDNFDIVTLKGTFDFPPACGRALTITRSVTLRGENDAEGNRANIMANNNNKPAVFIDSPGSTVELDNLHIESASERIIHVGAIWAAPWDACKDLTVTNCEILGTSSGCAAIGTFGSVTGTIYLEGNHITGSWCAGDWIWWVGPSSNCKWEVYSNNLVATQMCLDAIASKGVRIEDNICEGPGILHCPATEGEIVVRDNVMLQSGHFVFGGNNIASGMIVSHGDGFSGGLISGNTVVMEPTENLNWSPDAAGIPAIWLGDAFAGKGAHRLLVQDNTTTGKADFAIALTHNASDNIVRHNNLKGFTATKHSIFGATQILLDSGCENNVFRDNIIGPLGNGALAGIWCAGDNNDFVRNDYMQSGISGLTAAGIPCVLLANQVNPATGEVLDAPENNLVFEPGGFPPGATTAATEQVLDEPRELTGTTTNIVVGH